MDAPEAIERLRQIWTPNREVEEISADLAPQTLLDSQIRHLLHALVQQGAVSTKVNLDIPNTGTLRWEVVTLEPAGSRVVNVWVEE